MQTKMEQNIQMNKQDSGRSARAASSKPSVDFQKFMTKRGCPTMDCLKEMCFPAGEVCGPIAAFPILSVCASGEGCVPNPGNLVATGGALQVAHFTDSKIAGKLGICVTGFNSILSWLGLEACLAAIQLEYYYFKSQLDASIYAAYVVIKLTAGMKAQVAQSFRSGAGAGIVVDGKTVKDICTHDKHKCEDYCKWQNGDIGVYVKVEYWWWGWKEAVNQATDPRKNCK